ncbi:hypothetical protein Vretifemale_15881, partial [Volvox reticuliferus]
ALPQLRPHVAAIAVLAPPIGFVGRFMLGAGSSWEALAGPRSTVRDIPRLICCGDRDQFVSMRQLKNAVQQAFRTEAGEATKAAVAAKALYPAASAAGATSGSSAAAATTDVAMIDIAFPPAAQPAAVSTLELVLWPGCDHFFFDCRDAGALEAAGLLGRYSPGTTSTSTFGGGGRGGAGVSDTHGRRDGSRDRDGGVRTSVGTGRDNPDIAAAACSASASIGSRIGASDNAIANASMEGRESLRPGHRITPSKALADFVVGWLLAKAGEPAQP